MCRESRRGLSTLELVMALPILLFVMALMINYGTVASWKVRGLSVARHALWSQREGHTGSGFPATQYWPQGYLTSASPAVTQGSGGWPVTSLNGIEQVDGADLPVARGPTVGDATVPPAQPFIVNQSLLDPARGIREGNSTVQRRHTLLKRLGQYTLRSATQLLEGPLTFPAVGASDNDDFRVPLIYTVPATPDPIYALNYIQAVAKIYYAPFQADLWPLDKDDEFRYWKQRFRAQGLVNWPGYGIGHDFIGQYGSLGSFCDLDAAGIQNQVDGLVDRIQGSNGQTNFAENVRRDFKRFFEEVVKELKNELNATPPPPPAVQVQLQQEIQDLEAKIGLLQTPLN